MSQREQYRIIHLKKGGRLLQVWLIKAGEALPNEKTQDRLRRMGLIAAELINRGHSVTWFNSTFHHARKLQRYKKDTLLHISVNFKIRLIRANSYKRNVSVQRIIHHFVTAQKFRILARKLDKPDVILCSMPTIDLAEIAVKYGIENNIPTVVDIRDLWPDIYFEVLPIAHRFFIKPYVRYSRMRLKKLLIGATAIVSLTPGFLDWGLSYANRDRTLYDRVFYMGYKRLEYNQNDKKGEWCNYNFNPEDFIVCFFGTLGRQFNYEPILEAAMLLQNDKNIKFVVCGDGEFLPLLKKQSHDLPNMIYPGWINERQIQQLLRIAAAGLAPYRKSMNFTLNIPNKFSEYLSAAIPILLGIEGEMGNLIDEFGCGYVYNNGEQLAQFITNLKSEPNVRIGMSKNALKLYNEKFDAKIVYSSMVQYLEEVFEANPNGVKQKDKNENNGKLKCIL
jgi:glycosyltransferase involved in cell wall biosynthesis